MCCRIVYVVDPNHTVWSGPAMATAHNTRGLWPHSLNGYWMVVQWAMITVCRWVSSRVPANLRASSTCMMCIDVSLCVIRYWRRPCDSFSFQMCNAWLSCSPWNMPLSPEIRSNRRKDRPKPYSVHVRYDSTQRLFVRIEYIGSDDVRWSMVCMRSSSPKHSHIIYCLWMEMRSAARYRETSDGRCQPIWQIEIMVERIPKRSVFIIRRP